MSLFRGNVMILLAVCSFSALLHVATSDPFEELDTNFGPIEVKMLARHLSREACVNLTATIHADAVRRWLAARRTEESKDELGPTAALPQPSDAEFRTILGKISCLRLVKLWTDGESDDWILRQLEEVNQQPLASKILRRINRRLKTEFEESAKRFLGNENDEESHEEEEQEEASTVAIVPAKAYRMRRELATGNENDGEQNQQSEAAEDDAATVEVSGSDDVNEKFEMPNRAAEIDWKEAVEEVNAGLERNDAKHLWAAAKFFVLLTLAPCLAFLLICYVCANKGNCLPSCCCLQKLQHRSKRFTTAKRR